MFKEIKQLNKSKDKRIQLPIHENQSNHHTDTHIYYEDIQASTPSGHRASAILHKCTNKTHALV